MSPFIGFMEKPGGFWLLMTALLLMICQTAVFLLALYEKRSRRQIAAAALHLAIGFLFFVIVLDGYDSIHFETIPRQSTQSGWFVYKLPWLVYGFLEMVSAVILVFCFQEYIRYKTGTVTYSAIRQSMDLLPEGICIGTEDGTVLLANMKMNALCREITGERLSDSHQLWMELEKNGSAQGSGRLIHTPHGEAWLFTSEPLSLDGKVYERTSAVDVTEKDRITEELREKNVRLQTIQRRMKEAAELSGEMFIKQEEANARSALHNELGQVLLAGRYSIEHPESTNRAFVAMMTRQMNRFLLGESKAPVTKPEDEWLQAIHMAGRVGGNGERQGDPPKERTARILLAAAGRECASDTGKHAGGKGSPL